MGAMVSFWEIVVDRLVVALLVFGLCVAPRRSLPDRRSPGLPGRLCSADNDLLTGLQRAILGRVLQSESLVSLNGARPLLERTA